MARPLSTTKEIILAAAMDLLARNGLRGMSIRSVAGVLGLAPNAMYSYFADREHLQAAVAAEVAAKLHAMLLKSCEEKAVDEPIVSLARAYLRFAREQHLLYEALVVTRPNTGEDAIAPERLWLFFLDQVRQITGDARAQEAAVALWAFLHGIAALQSAQAFNEEKPASSIEFGLAAWMQAAKAVRDGDPASGASAGQSAPPDAAGAVDSNAAREASDNMQGNCGTSLNRRAAKGKPNAF
jgi:AcrR family transcriptional regulator